MKYGRYGVKAEANAIPDAPRNERATGKTQQPIGKTEKNAENTETPLATAVREPINLSVLHSIKSRLLADSLTLELALG